MSHLDDKGDSLRDEISINRKHTNLDADYVMSTQVSLLNQHPIKL